MLAVFWKGISADLSVSKLTSYTGKGTSALGHMTFPIVSLCVLAVLAILSICGKLCFLAAYLFPQVSKLAFLGSLGLGFSVFLRPFLYLKLWELLSC